MPLLPRVAPALLATALAVGLVAGCAPAEPEPPAPRTPIPPVSEAQLRLPEPTGPHATGTTLVPLTDPARDRELVTQFWYPTTAAEGPVAPYAPDAEAEQMAAFYPVAPGAYAPASTKSRLDTPAAAGERPVVLLAHGLCGFRTDLTGVAEQLASEGFVVAATGNTGEAGGVELADGRLVEADTGACATAGEGESPEGRAAIEGLLTTRVADQRLVLDTLERGEGLPHGLDAAADPTRAVGVGHSLGGATMIQLAADDPRVQGAVNLDGYIHGPVAATGTPEPVLVVGVEGHTPEADPSWARAFPGLTGLQWLAVPGTAHYSFVDMGGRVDEWVEQGRTDPMTRAMLTGDADSARVQQMTIDLSAAFARRTLLGTEEPLLAGPNPTLGGVQFRR